MDGHPCAHDHNAFISQALQCLPNAEMLIHILVVIKRHLHD